MRIAVAALALTSATWVGALEEWRQDPNVLTCSPQVLSSSQALTLTLGPNHGGELGIRRLLDDRLFLLVVGSSPPSHFQLMTTAEFAAADSVEIQPNIVATAWMVDAKPELVFSGPGEYEIVVSPNLESEVGGHFCRVTFGSR